MSVSVTLAFVWGVPVRTQRAATSAFAPLATSSLQTVMPALVSGQSVSYECSSVVARVIHHALLHSDIINITIIIVKAQGK